jgi:hypothetical protein
VFFRDERRPRYDLLRQVEHLTPERKVEILNAELDRHAV